MKLTRRQALTGTAALAASTALPLPTRRVFLKPTAALRAVGNASVYPIFASYIMPQPGGQLAVELVQEFERQRGKQVKT
jgi:hypothetical protein